MHPSSTINLHDQHGARISYHGVEADDHSVTSLAGNTIISSHIHFKAGANTQVHTGVWTDFIELDVCGADAVIIQAEGEVAASVRLRLRAVPPTPASHVS